MTCCGPCEDSDLFHRSLHFGGGSLEVPSSSASSLLADTEERKFATWGSLKPRRNFWHLPSQSLKSELAQCRGVCLLRKVGVCSDESESVTSVKTGLPSGLVALAWVGMEGLGRGWKGEQRDPPFACSHCWDF